MKVLLDQNLPPAACALLREHDIDAVHCQDCALGDASDEEILEWCRSESRVLFTRDADFHALLARSGALSPSVVRIRTEGLKESGIASIVRATLLEIGHDLSRGVAVSLNENSLRIHNLPLVAKEEE